jgi:hypothetical protein
VASKKITKNPNQPGKKIPMANSQKTRTNFFLPAASKQSKMTKNKRSFFTSVLANSHPVKNEKEQKNHFFLPGVGSFWPPGYFQFTDM